MASDASRMPKVDMSKEFDNLSKTEQHFIKKLEQMNKERAKDLRVLRKRNLFTGLLFAGGVFGICILTIIFNHPRVGA